jgi:GT2 family glycosyltransferase
MTSPVSAIVVPTLGLRNEFLIQCLRSIRKSGNAHICLVSPNLHQVEHFREEGLMDQHVLDACEGLPAAINNGINCLPGQIEFVNWLGDDDLLKEGALNSMQALLQSNPQIGMVFGKCNYIDEQGSKIWKNSSGQWASFLLPVGPCLVPQPGALFRRDLFNQVNGLNQELRWAFDLDLFLRMKKVSKLKFFPIDAASFRWHPDSLSVGMREGSVSEASTVRKLHLAPLFRPISFLWEFPVKKATYLAGMRLSSRIETKLK